MQALFSEGFEGYFDQHKQREKISTTPFARAPQLDSSQYVQLVNNVNELKDYKKIQDFRKTEHQKFYSQWALELEQGFNLLFFGVGSKIDLLKSFLANWDPTVGVVGVNGYNPATNLKDVINTCVNLVVPNIISDQWLKQPNERLPLFLDYLQVNNQYLAVFVNSIDGCALRNVKTQSMLARLAQSKHIMFFATCDHINAPLQWSQSLRKMFNFVYHHTPTYMPYNVETSYMDVFSLGQSRASVGVHAVKTVLESLTANIQSMYKLLVTVQYENMVSMGITDPNTNGLASHGIEVQKFYKLCVSKFVVSSEANFKGMFSEFKEHKMLEVAKDKTGLEIVFVPYSFDDLEQIIGDFSKA